MHFLWRGCYQSRITGGERHSFIKDAAKQAEASIQITGNPTSQDLVVMWDS
jgi:hypothetical protein